MPIDYRYVTETNVNLRVAAGGTKLFLSASAQSWRRRLDAFQIAPRTLTFQSRDGRGGGGSRGSAWDSPRQTRQLGLGSSWDMARDPGVVTGGAICSLTRSGRRRAGPVSSLPWPGRGRRVCQPETGLSPTLPFTSQRRSLGGGRWRIDAAGQLAGTLDRR